MLLKAALLLLFVWLLGAVGIYDVGIIVHVLLLVGLMLLLIGVLKGRDAAIEANRRAPTRDDSRRAGLGPLEETTRDIRRETR